MRTAWIVAAAVLGLALDMHAQQAGPRDMPQEMVWVDRMGDVLGRVGAVQNTMFFPEISPDGEKIALSARDGEVNDRDIWIHDISSGRKRVVASAKGNDNFPLWSPEGSEILFTSSSSGNYELYKVAADGSSDPTVVLETPDSQYPRAISPDGLSLVFTHAVADGRRMIVLKLATDEQRDLLPDMTAWADGARYSPDGRWIVWSANPNGLWETFVAPASDPSAGLKITRDLSQGWAGGGAQARWRADGKELYYVMGDALMALPFEDGGTPEPSAAKRLFSIAGFRGNFPDEAPWLAGYAVAADGWKFVFVRTVKK